MIKKNGRNMVKKAFVKFNDIYPLTLTINDSFQELCCLCVIEVDYESGQG